MRTEQITKTYLQFNELDDKQKQTVVETFDNDGWMYEHCLIERIDTLKKLAEYLNGNLDYCISCVPDRGEFITIKPIDNELDFDSLWDVIDVEEDCPLTGVCYDHDIIDHLSKYF